MVKVRDERAAREAADLRQRVAELEGRLAAQRVEQMRHPDGPVLEAQQADKRPRRETWQERMARMQREHPEQAAEMARRREAFRDRIEKSAHDRAEFLAAVDVRNMTGVQREQHERLLDAVARANEMMAEIGEGGPRDPAWRREMGELMGTLTGGLVEARRYLFEETARAVGYQGEDAAVLADHLQTIVDNTTLMPAFGRGGGRRNVPQER